MGGVFLHLSEAKGEVGRQLVGEPEGDGEGVREMASGVVKGIE